MTVRRFLFHVAVMKSIRSCGIEGLGTRLVNHLIQRSIYDLCLIEQCVSTDSVSSSQPSYQNTSSFPDSQQLPLSQPLPQLPPTSLPTNASYTHCRIQPQPAPLSTFHMLEATNTLSRVDPQHLPVIALSLTLQPQTSPPLSLQR